MKATLNHEQVNIEAEWNENMAWDEWVKLRNERKVLFTRCFEVTSFERFVNNLVNCPIQWTHLYKNVLRGQTPQCVPYYEDEEFVVRFDRQLTKEEENLLREILDDNEEGWIWVDYLNQCALKCWEQK